MRFLAINRIHLLLLIGFICWNVAPLNCIKRTSPSKDGGVIDLFLPRLLDTILYFLLGPKQARVGWNPVA